MPPSLPSILANLRSQTGLNRELLILVACVLVGLLAMPWVMWIIGRATLGAYANGGPFSLWADFFRGLGHGALPFWGIALGPYVAVGLLRTMVGIRRRLPS